MLSRLLTDNTDFVNTVLSIDQLSGWSDGQPIEEWLVRESIMLLPSSVHDIAFARFL